MMTRRGSKRSSESFPKKKIDQSFIQKKKSKLDDTQVLKSKYFDGGSNEESADINMKDSGLEMEGENSSESGDSLILKRSKNIPHIKDESDSESSSDEFMKVPFSLDDLGDFETLKKKGESKISTKTEPRSSASVSRLSDSDEEKEAVNSVEKDYYDFSDIIHSQQLIMTTRKVQENQVELEKPTLLKVSSKSKKRAKKGVDNSNITKPAVVGEDLGISELLAMTEGTRNSVSSESEDEEPNPEETPYSVPQEGVQVTIELPNTQQKKKSKGFDIEAAMKRRLNLIRKENQIFMHKVHTLCWLAHGIYLNRIINSDNLIGLALSLIPSKHCYPSKHADLNYLEKLVEWFVNKISVAKINKGLNKTEMPIADTLEEEINSKVVFSQRDLVLIFVCMVRSLGIDARLVISLRSVPLRPPLSDLCTVSNKPKATISSSSGSKEKKNHTPTKELEHNTKEQSKSASGNKNSKSNKVNKDSSPKEVKSLYFSSSDELPLEELKKINSLKKSVSRKGNKPSISPETINPVASTTTKSKKLDKSNPQSVISNVKKNKTIVDTKPVKDMGKDKNKTDRPRLAKSRKSQSTPLQDAIITSSEDELEVPEKTLNITKTTSKKMDSKAKNSSSLKKKSLEDCDFKPPKVMNSKKKSIDRRVLSSDDEKNTEKKIGNDYWAEVFLEAEEKWISVDLRKGKVHCIHQLYNAATQPVRYVIAWNNDGSMKDVTRRYAPQWLTVTRRQRADDMWWKKTMAPYTPIRTARDKEEDEDLDRQMHDKPLPTSISEYKNHPLFALRRHLLKFEAIYPPDAPPLGFIKNEPVYSRGCVAELHTRETWIKEAKLVRRGEEPYKIVKARPKWDKLSGRVINDLPLPLFGHWQVEDYIPPPAVDGKVPRNDYGNVELYKPCMLPPGTVHLQVPQLARVARKLGIDCAPAVVGWEFSGGSSHPVLDGFIVCEEFKEALLDAWSTEMDESAKRAKEKVERRVYGNWKRLIRGLLIRERLQLRYEFGSPEPEKKKKKQQSKPSTSKS